MSRGTPFSAMEYLFFALFVLMISWLGPLLERRGYHAWAIVLQMIGAFGAVICLLMSWGN